MDCNGDLPGTDGTAGTGCDDVAHVCSGCLIKVPGVIPFVTEMISVTDDSGGTTATVRTEPGAICMSGTSLQLSVLALSLRNPASPCCKNTQQFDAAALGITQIEFTVTSPPTTGVNIAVQTMNPDCTDFSHARPGYEAGAACGLLFFQLMSGGKPVSVLPPSPSPTRVLLSDAQNPDHVLDPSALLALGFGVGALEHYDFCVRDLKFLNDAGSVVLPP